MARLKLSEADQIISTALALAREQNCKPLGVVVLDDGGHVVALKREDGASMFRIDVATAKAWGCVAMGVSSHAIALRAAKNPNFFAALAATSNGRLLPGKGGVVIRDRDGTLLGAVGVSGGTSDQDEACAVAGIKAAQLVPDTSTD